MAFQVAGPPPERLLACNCSICRRKGTLHWIVARERFRLTTPEDAYATYRFGTGVAQHHFCRTCGITPFYVPRSHPERIDVNARCLEDFEWERLPVDAFDGAHWEEAIGALRARTD